MISVCILTLARAHPRRRPRALPRGKNTSHRLLKLSKQTLARATRSQIRPT